MLPVISATKTATHAAAPSTSQMRIARAISARAPRTQTNALLPGVL
jgi:hypothetical protein